MSLLNIKVRTKGIIIRKMITKVLYLNNESENMILNIRIQQTRYEIRRQPPESLKLLIYDIIIVCKL